MQDEPAQYVDMKTAVVMWQLIPGRVLIYHFATGNECDDDIPMQEKIRSSVLYIMGRSGLDDINFKFNSAMLKIHVAMVRNDLDVSKLQPSR